MGTFPYLDDADTMIILSDVRHLKLNSAVLKQRSGRLSRLLAEEGAKLRKEVQAGNLRYQLVLQNYSMHTGEEIEPTLRRVYLNSWGRPLQSVSIIHENEETNIDPKLYTYYHKILGSFFDVELTIDTTNMATAMEEALGLSNCAEYLECMSHTCKPIENALISMGQELCQGIAAAPIEWIDLGYRLSSKFIFKEALIHLTGRYNEFDHIESNDYDDADVNFSAIRKLRGPIRKVLEKKLAELKAKCRAVDQQMVTFYPPYMQRESISGRADRDDIGQSSYGRDVFAWQALSVFRHWLGQSLALSHTHQAYDGGYTFYKCVNQGGDRYLDPASLSGFHGRFPMTAKAKTILKNHLDYLKVQGQMYTKSLIKNESNLDTDRYEVKWLTCTQVEASEYPWIQTDIHQDTEAKEDDVAFDADDDEDDYASGSGEDMAEGSESGDIGLADDLDREVEEQYEEIRQRELNRDFQQEVEDQYKHARRAVRHDMTKSMIWL